MHADTPAARRREREAGVHRLGYVEAAQAARTSTSRPRPAYWVMWESNQVLIDASLGPHT